MDLSKLAIIETGVINFGITKVKYNSNGNYTKMRNTCFSLDRLSE
jgi:hypothetical protein